MRKPFLTFPIVALLAVAIGTAAFAEPRIVAAFGGPFATNCRWPCSVIADPASDGWLVASAKDSSIVRLRADGTPTASLPLPAPPSWIGRGGRPEIVLAVSTEGNMIFRIDPYRWRIVSSAPTGPRPVCAVGYGQHCYVVNAGDGTVSRLVGATLDLNRILSVDEDPSCIALDAASRRLLVGSAATGAVSEFDANSLRPIGSVQTGMMPVAICVDTARSLGYVVDQLDSTVTVLDLSARPMRLAYRVPIGDCPLSAALDERTGILYVACNTSPAASIWALDPTTRTAAVLAELPYGPDPASVAVRTGRGLCAVSRCAGGVSLASLAGGEAVTVPVGYVLRDITSNPALGQVYAAYSSEVPGPDGGPPGLIGVWDHLTLAPVNAFPCVAPAAIAPWIGGSKLVVGGADRFVCVYDVPGGGFAAGGPVLPPGRTYAAWLGICVAENYPGFGPAAFAQDMWSWSATLYRLRLPDAAVSGPSYSGDGGNSSWLGFWEADARLFEAGDRRLYVSRNGPDYMPSYYAQVPVSGRPSQPRNDGLVYVPSTRRPLNRIYAYTAAGGEGSGFRLNLCAQADAPDRYPVAAARNELTGRVYVANYGDGTVAVYDGALRRSDTIAVGGHPFRLWADETTNLVYVGDCGSDRITVIEDVATIPTLSVSEAVATPDGMVARVQGGVVKSLPLSRGATGYLWYYFDVEPEDHSATLTVWRQRSPPAVEIGSRVEMVGTIESLPTTSSTRKKSIVARELTVQ
jgi:YVTN family beta-propeller protein